MSDPLAQRLREEAEKLERQAKLCRAAARALEDVDAKLPPQPVLFPNRKRLDA